MLPENSVRYKQLSVLTPLAMLCSALSWAMPANAVELELASVAAFADVAPSNGASANARGSADLQVIVFDSAAENLVSADSNRFRDVFRRDAQGTRLISRSTAAAANGDSTTPDVSADGEWVVFSSSASNLVANDLNEVADIFVYRHSTGTLQRLTPPGGESNGASYAPRISANGQRVVFLSAATNWTGTDQNGLEEVIAYDLVSDTVFRASMGFSGDEITDHPPRNPQISPDGQCVSIESVSSQYDLTDSNNIVDYFIATLGGAGANRASTGSFWAQLTAVTGSQHLLLSCSQLIFHSTDGVGAIGQPIPGYFLNNGGLTSLLPVDAWANSSDVRMAASTNGQHVVFGSNQAGNAGVTEQRVNLATMAVQNSTVTLGVPQAISDDGAKVVSMSLNPVAIADRNVLDDLVLRELPSGLQVWISRASATQPASLAANGGSAIGFGVYANDKLLRNRHQALSANGRYVLYSSHASNLVLDDTNGVEDVFRYDRQLQQTVRVNQTAIGGETTEPSAATDLSDDGNIVLFESCDDMGVVSSPTVCDLFAKNMQTGVTLPVSVSSSGIPANRGGSFSSGFWGRLSGDGQYVVFVSSANNLVDGQNTFAHRIYLRDRQLGVTSFVDFGSRPAISRNGRFVVYVRNGLTVFDRSTGQTSILPLVPGGGVLGGIVDWPNISESGRYVSYYSDANDLVAGDQDGVFDVFVFDRDTSTNTLISVAEGPVAGVLGGAISALSVDGRKVAYFTDNTNSLGELVAPQNVQGILVDWQTGQRQAFAGADVLDPSRAVLRRPRFSSDGSALVFAADQLSRSPIDVTGGMVDIYVSSTEISNLFSNGFE